QVKVASALVGKGAEVNARNRLGQTPLHMACVSQQVEMVKFLLEHGATASLAMRDRFGVTPLLYAVTSLKQDEHMVVTPFVGSSVTKTASQPSEAIVDLLLAAGADLHAPSQNGNTPLHLAAFKGFASMVALLLARGA